MKNPVITVVEQNFLMISQQTRHLLLQISVDIHFSQTLLCHFYQKDEDLFACVFAPHNEPRQLAARAISYLGAYIRIKDRHRMEHELLRNIETFLHY